VVTNICPACGYPTLHPTLCAFCYPSAATTGNHGIGRASFTRMPDREPSWITLRDSYANSPACVGAWPGPMAS